MKLDEASNDIRKKVARNRVMVGRRPATVLLLTSWVSAPLRGQ
jgi:hypothetical protein